MKPIRRVQELLYQRLSFIEAQGYVWTWEFADKFNLSLTGAINFLRRWSERGMVKELVIGAFKLTDQGRQFLSDMEELYRLRAKAEKSKER